MFLLAIQTLTEFALRYSTNNGKHNKILINSEFDGIVEEEDQEKFLISIKFRMNLNQAYDSKTVLELFSCTKLQEAFQKDDIDAFYLDR